MEGLHEFHKTKRGYIIFGLLELIALYIFVSISIDTANMFAYAASIILLIGVIINIKNAVTLQIKDSKK